MKSLVHNLTDNNSSNDNDGNILQSNNIYKSNLEPQSEVKLPIFKFLDGIEHELSQIKKKTLESTTMNNLQTYFNKNFEGDIRLSETDKKKTRT